MKIKTAISALKEKQAIISRTDDDHWLYEPIATVLEELEIYKMALEKACNELDCSSIDDFAPHGWVCANADWKCDRRCEYNDGKFKGTLSYDAINCWCDYFIQKARKENGNNQN